MIHPTAIIHESAKIADNVEIGPGAIIGANVEIDSGTSIGAYAVIVGPIKIGKDNQIFQFASVGEASQDRKYQDEETQTIIGERNMIREFCTVHRGTKQGGGVTRIGNDNVFMVGAHIAHDCQVGNSCTIANYSSLAGHVVMDDFVIMSGYCGIHQFCHLGENCFIARNAMVMKDVMAYTMIQGPKTVVSGLNAEGLKRRGFSPETLKVIKQAYRVIFRDGKTTAESIDALAALVKTTPEVEPMINMLRTSERGIVRGAATGS